MIAVFLLVVPCPGMAARDGESDEPKSVSSAPKKIGGLLFDFDEGVEIEEGPGGSVYVRSNREYMQKKFKEIENRFHALENRVANLESKVPSAGGSQDTKQEESQDGAPLGPRVLSA